MRKRIFQLISFSVLAILSCNTTLTAQTDISQQKAPKIRSPIWFTPNGVNKINGLAVGLQAMNWNGKHLTINGVNLSAGAVPILLTAYVVAYSFKTVQNIDAPILLLNSAATTIKGVSLSLGGEGNISIHGINISGAITTAYKLNGISITGYFSICNAFNGVSIAGFRNIAAKGRGLQIGLFNNCKELKGLQVGLWNKNGRRGLPFINWRF